MFNHWEGVNSRLFAVKNFINFIIKTPLTFDAGVNSAKIERKIVWAAGQIWGTGGEIFQPGPQTIFLGGNVYLIHPVILSKIIRVYSRSFAVKYNLCNLCNLRIPLLYLLTSEF